MKIFSSIGEVDYDWIRKREVVDYGYKGEFSPKNIIPLLEQIE